jgi:hypothetical protein
MMILVLLLALAGIASGAAGLAVAHGLGPARDDRLALARILQAVGAVLILLALLAAPGRGGISAFGALGEQQSSR